MVNQNRELNQIFSLHVSNHLFTGSFYWDFVWSFFVLMLKNDLISSGDITSELFIDDGKEVNARIIAKKNGILAGREELEYILENLPKLGKGVLPGINSKSFGDICRNFGFSFNFKDGEEFKKGDLLVEFAGNVRLILLLERFVLNFLMRMSGIATYTRELVKKINRSKDSGDSGNSEVSEVSGFSEVSEEPKMALESKGYEKSNLPKLAATRKTLWGFLDKKAVVIGGGWSHRLNLSDAVLVKDSHLDSLHNGDLCNGIEATDYNLGEFFERLEKSNLSPRFIEFEMESEKQALDFLGKLEKLVIKNLENRDYNIEDLKSIKGLKRGKKLGEIPIIIMLDNFSPQELIKTLKNLKSSKEFKKIQQLKILNDDLINQQKNSNSKLPKKSKQFDILFEASGGINEKNLQEYTKTGVDIISTSCLTMQANAIDMSLKIIKKTTR